MPAPESYSFNDVLAKTSADAADEQGPQHSLLPDEFHAPASRVGYGTTTGTAGAEAPTSGVPNAGLDTTATGPYAGNLGSPFTIGAGAESSGAPQAGAYAPQFGSYDSLAQPQVDPNANGENGTFQWRAHYGGVAPSALEATSPNGPGGAFQPQAPMNPGSPYEQVPGPQQQQQQQQLEYDPATGRYYLPAQNQNPGYPQGPTGAPAPEAPQAPPAAPAETPADTSTTTTADSGSSSDSSTDSAGGSKWQNGFFGERVLGLGSALGARHVALNGLDLKNGFSIKAGGEKFVANEAFSGAVAKDMKVAPLTKGLGLGLISDYALDQTVFKNKDSTWKTPAADVLSTVAAAAISRSGGGLARPLATMLVGHSLGKVLEKDKPE